MKKIIIRHTIRELHYLGNAVYVRNTTGSTVTDTTYYLHKDHLGSLATVVFSAAGGAGGGQIVGKYSYDVCVSRNCDSKHREGRRRNYDNFTYTINSTLSTNYFDRFYTMHETIFSPSWGGGAGGGGLINMNGRLYDPLLARMLSPDNYVQAAGNTQSYNRYSYVWNNPLKFTDPSGDFLTWSVSKDGFSIGINFSPIGIPLGFGVNVGSTSGVYGEVGYRVGGTGLGAGAAAQQSVGWNFAGGSWSTTTTVSAYASFLIFNAGASVSATHDITYGGWSSSWSVSAGVGIGNGTAGIGLNVSYGSNGWSYGLGGYYQSNTSGPGHGTRDDDEGIPSIEKKPIPDPTPNTEPQLLIEKMKPSALSDNQMQNSIPNKMNAEGIRMIDNPLEGTTYTPKVQQQMQLGDYHSFPQQVDAFGSGAKVTSLVGGDGVKRSLVEISGSWRGSNGVFQYIVEPNGMINHRLFIPIK